MTEQTTSKHVPADGHERSGAAVGFTVFAAVLMIMGGAFQSLNGIVAISEDEFFLQVGDYVAKFDTTQWGWIHLILGILVLLAGLGVLSGQVWARTVGVVLAAISAFAYFAFIPYYPVWSIVVIALDVFIIWALTAHGRDITR